MKPPHHIDTQVRSQRILLAEDDEDMRELLAQVLRRAGFDVTEYEEAWFLKAGILPTMKGNAVNPVDLVISDIRMPGLSGLDVLKELRQKGSELPVMLITALGDEETHLLARKLGAVALLDKPFDIDNFVACVKSILGKDKEAGLCDEVHSH